MLIFLHIPRTGGTSFKKILKEVYGEGGLWVHAPALSSANKACHAALQRGGLKAVYGHMPYGIHRVLGPKSRYITMLRDPVENIYSEFCYSKKTKDHYLQPIADLPFGKWLEKGMSAWDVNNPQTRYLAGLDWVGWRPRFPLGQKLDVRHLELAKERLEKFAVVGVTDRIGAFVRTCSKKFVWGSIPAVPELNASGVVSSRRPPRRKSLPPKVVDRMDELLHFDLELYRFALEIAA